MTIKLTEIAVLQLRQYLKDICDNVSPTEKDIENEALDIIATKLSDYPIHELKAHVYFQVKGISITDPLYDETGRYRLLNAISYWIEMGVDKNIATDAVQNARICAL